MDIILKRTMLNASSKVSLLRDLMDKKPGYHLSEIPKGVIGESSKIAEEVAELIDAEQQDCKIMALVELSDLYGAMEAYLSKNYPDIRMSDLRTMSKITMRAFVNGHRG